MSTTNKGHLPYIINSLLTTDAYKFSMGQTIFHQFQDYTTEWDFKCRNKSTGEDNVKFTAAMVNEIRYQIKHYCDLQFKEEELEYLASIKYIKQDYINFLRYWRPFYDDFTISTEDDCGLKILAKGTWLNTSMYEIPVLAIVNEVYFRMRYDYDKLLRDFKERFDDKLNKLLTCDYELGTFSEFGLRRRLSGEAEDYAIQKFVENKDALAKKGSHFAGSSNVELAMKYKIIPIGTLAHEFIESVGQGDMKLNPAYSNWYGMESWTKEYGVLNGTWLTDTIGEEACRRDMGLTYSILFSGVRHDSGDPYEWGDKWIQHYQDLYDKFHDERVNPKIKTLLFSDSLNFEKATSIYRYFKGKAKVAFGIGTFITNDTSVPPLNIVMKVAYCNGHDVAKLSNDPGKSMCRNKDYIEYLSKTIRWRLEHEEH